MNMRGVVKDFNALRTNQEIEVGEDDDDTELYEGS